MEHQNSLGSKCACVSTVFTAVTVAVFARHLSCSSMRKQPLSSGCVQSHDTKDFDRRDLNGANYKAFGSWFNARPCVV
eukprot:1967790-Amphidinium_carterae.3